MRKSQKLLSLCLGLVLSLGVSGCDDLPSSLDDVGGDEDITSEDLDEESEEPSEPVVSYQVEITNEGPISLEVGQSVTIDLAFYIVTDDVKSSEEGRATLYSSEEGIVSIDGYTVTALKEGETIISANWTEHDVTSNGLTVTVAEPIVTPTTEYSIAITSPASGTSILTNTATSIGVSLTTTVDGTPIVEDGNAETVKLNVSPDTSSVKVEGLTITGTASETVTITATWIEQDITSESISITFVEPSVDPEITYGVTITSPTTETVLYVGSSLTVAATLYTYSDEAVSGSDYATADNVTLTLDENSTGSVTISGLTITGVSAGTVTLTATWGEYASASVTFTVESVYTYAIEISNPTAETTLDVGQTLEVSATLLSYTDGTLTGSETATGSNVTVTQTSGEGSITTSGLTVTGVSAGTVTLTVTWGEYASADVTFEVKSVITYGVAITSPSNGSEVEVGSALTFTIDLITYTDNVETSRDTTTTTGVELTQSSSDGGEVEINGLTITGKTAGSVTITATWTEHSVSDSITITVTEPEQVFESYTITIQLKTSSGEAFPAPTDTTYSVFINSAYDMTYGGEDGDYWESWTTHIMTYDASSDTYSYTYESLPTTVKDSYTAKFYASPTTSESDIYWETGYLGEHEITVTQDSVGAIKETIEITTTFTSWDDIFNPPASDVTFIYTITFAYEGTTLEAAGEGIDLYAAGDFNGTWNDGTGSGGWYDWGSPVQLDNIGNGSYTLTLDFVPENGRSFEILVNDTSDSEQDMWTYILAEYTIIDNDTTAKGTITKSITLEAEAASIYDLLNPGFEVTIAIKDSGSNNNTTQFYIEGEGIGWSLVAMDKVSGNDSYDQYYTYHQAKTSNIKFWIGGNIDTSGDGYYHGVGNSSGSVSWDESGYYSWVTESEWGFDISNVSSENTSWAAASSITIILTFPFSSYNSSSTNYLVTNVSVSIA